MEWLLPGAGALWLGLLTSISPCPLTTNIAAVSYLGREVATPRRVILGGLCYTLGRTIAYVALAALLVAGLLAASPLSMALQAQLPAIVGPVLVVTGGVLLTGKGLAPPGLGRLGERAGARAAAAGSWGAVALGALFALAFCPVSAALYFGSLIPLALESRSVVLLPTLYGIGTALPVVLFALVVGYGAHHLGRAVDRVLTFDRWMRRATGAVLLAIGLYMTLRYTLAIV